MINEVLIVGGGAAGMMAAIAAARNGAKVTILEQNNELGKKILATGNGRCNYTNTNIYKEAYYSSDMEFVEDVIKEYPTSTIIEFFESIGISPRYRGDYVYPWNDQALSIREALQGEIFRLGVEIKWETIVQTIEISQDKDSKHLYRIHTNNGVYTGNVCILATGGESGLSPKVVKKGFDLIPYTKHSVTNLSPALVGLKSSASYFKRLAGVRCDGAIRLYVDNKQVKSEVGEIQLADYGISGIPVFQVSRIAGMALQNNQSVKAVMDFIPQYSEDELYELLNKRKELFKERKMKSFMNGLFKEKLGLFLLEQCDLTVSTHVYDITNDKMRQFAHRCKNVDVDITGINDYNKAQVTAGGVTLQELKQTYESKLHKGLYFVGEVLDVDGICGGYNLHFAWASGLKAGGSCSNK